jgi:hypothetical protein
VQAQTWVCMHCSVSCPCVLTSEKWFII